MARSLLLLLAMVALVAALDSPSGVGAPVMATPTTLKTTRLTSTSSTTTTTIKSASETTSTGIATHTVQVGPRSDPHKYVPHTVNASVGDTIIFEFYPRNHSVVEADYDAPCVPAEKSNIFYSGQFDSYSDEELDTGSLINRAPPTWSVKINDTKPHFYYCTALESCYVNGMVGAINPNETMTWEHQYKKSLNSAFQLAPGEPWPSEGHEHGESSSSGSSSSSSKKLSSGAIAGIAVGGVAFIVILMILFFVLGRNRVYKKWMSSQDGRSERTARWAFFNSHTSAPRTAPSETVRKSEYEPGFQPMTADHHSGMYVASPEMTHASMASAPPYPYTRHGSPSPQQSMPVAGHWSWDMTPHQQQQQYPPPPPPPPVELD